MERTAEQLSVERVIAIDASPETVWQFLVDPEQARRWWGLGASFDARPGGAFRMLVTPGNAAKGEFVEVDPPRRLVYTWGWEEGGDGPNVVPPGSSTVEIELIPDGPGTTLRLVHRGLPSQASVESHRGGWDHYLARLQVVAAGGDPGTDPWLSGDV